jgi:cell division protein FtsL
MKVSPVSWLVLVVEVLVVLLTTFGIVNVTYQTRQQFAVLEMARNERQQLLEQWGRLLLEESAFSSPSRVERVAREKLGMVLPNVENIREIEISKGK